MVSFGIYLSPFGQENCSFGDVEINRPRIQVTMLSNGKS